MDKLLDNLFCHGTCIDQDKQENDDIKKTNWFS